MTYQQARKLRPDDPVVTKLTKIPRVVNYIRDNPDAKTVMIHVKGGDVYHHRFLVLPPEPAPEEIDMSDIPIAPKE